MVRLSLLRLVEAVAKEAAPALNVPVVHSATERLPPLPSPRDLLRLYKINAQRHLSQNFILDSRITNKIVTKTGNIEGCYVCEVGPGPGNITRPILTNGAKHLIVIEKDRRFLPALELLADSSGNRMKIILGDIMDLSLENLFPKDLATKWNLYPPPFYIIGNLPFNISTPLIIKWLKHCSHHTGPFVHGRTQLTLTFQKEVADRMVAKPKTAARSRLSIVCQYLCHIDNMFTIPGRAFFPKPEVDVSVVKFTPRMRPLIQHPFELVNKVVTTLFQHRQKHIKYGINNLFPGSHRDLAQEMIDKSGIDERKRSFHLEIEEFKVLCDVYSQICNDNKGIFEYNYARSNTYVNEEVVNENEIINLCK